MRSSDKKMLFLSEISQFRRKTSRNTYCGSREEDNELDLALEPNLKIHMGVPQWGGDISGKRMASPVSLEAQ